MVIDYIDFKIESTRRKLIDFKIEYGKAWNKDKNENEIILADENNKILLVITLLNSFCSLRFFFILSIFYKMKFLIKMKKKIAKVQKLEGIII